MPFVWRGEWRHNDIYSLISVVDALTIFEEKCLNLIDARFNELERKLTAEYQAKIDELKSELQGLQDQKDRVMIH